MPMSGSMQQVERDALLGAAAVQAERVAVAAHEAHLLVGADPAQAADPRGEMSTSPVWHGKLGGLDALERPYS